MSRAKKAPPVTTAGHKGALVKEMQQLAHRHDLWRVFSDFVEMAAIGVANACDTSNPDHDKREARYIEAAKAYKPDELQAFPRMLAHLCMALECGMDDVLGEVFMELDLGSKWHGQFFTPYELCRLMASLTLGDDVQRQIDAKGFITVNEPACGGGAMIIAMAEELKAREVNYQRCMHVVAQDLDLKACHMAYLQFSLLHIPAVVIHGNTLACEDRSIWRTPAHIMGAWDWRLQRAQSQPEPANDNTPAAEPVPAQGETAPSVWQQAGLF